MPSPRKRIGFLPGVEIQEIIDNICREKGLSQSKVTGILVEEALKKRGLYNPKIDKKEIVDTITKVIFSDNFNSNKENVNNLRSNDFGLRDQVNEISYSNDEFNLLKDYIAFKRFKYMMKKVKDENVG